MLQTLQNLRSEFEISRVDCTSLLSISSRSKLFAIGTSSEWRGNRARG